MQFEWKLWYINGHKHPPIKAMDTGTGSSLALPVNSTGTGWNELSNILLSLLLLWLWQQLLLLLLLFFLSWWWSWSSSLQSSSFKKKSFLMHIINDDDDDDDDDNSYNHHSDTRSPTPTQTCTPYTVWGSCRRGRKPLSRCKRGPGPVWNSDGYSTAPDWTAPNTQLLQHSWASAQPQFCITGKNVHCHAETDRQTDR